MTRFFRLSKLPILALLFTFFSILTKAQNNSPVVTSGGYSLQIGASASTIRTEEIFTYTITFTADGNLVNITDLIPAPLVIDNIVHPATYSGNPVNFVQVGNAITVTFPSGINGSISGSFQVNVHFPANGGGCFNVKNGARMQINATTAIATREVEMSSIVTNVWHIQKYPIGLPYTANNPCQYSSLSNTVQYEIKIVKTSPTNIGAEQLAVTAISDLLGTSGGVIDVGSYQSTTIPASSINANGTINLPPGFVLNPANHVPYIARFNITYPATTGCVKNGAELRGTGSCGPRVYRDSVTVNKVEAFPSTFTLVKYVSTTGNVPGCTGRYIIRVRNTSAIGSANIFYNLTDIVPPCLTGVLPGPAPAGGNISPTTASSIYTMTNTGSVGLAPQTFHDYVINFTIGTGCAPVVTNTVSGTINGVTSTANGTFYLLPNAPTPCIQKAICGTGTRRIGDTVRFRIRIQNIGNVPLTNVSISDFLDPNNLEYIGNEVYYSTLTAAAQPCGNGISAPTGPNISGLSVSTVNSPSAVPLKWGIDTIPVACAYIGYPVCGSAYYLPAYYIEFSVRIKDTAGIGNIRNTASVLCDNMIAPVTGDVTFVTNGVINYSVEKQVSNNVATNYGNAITSSPGAIVYYKLKAKNLGLSIVRPTLVDLLPMDNGTTDNFIKHIGARGSNMNVTYNGFTSSSHLFSGQFFSPLTTSGITTNPELGITVGTVAPSWTNVPSAVPNIKTDISQSIGLSPDLSYIFSGKLAANARTGDAACNSFALRGSAKYLYNFLSDYQLLPAIESNVACVSIAQSNPCCDPYEFVVPSRLCLNVAAEFCALDTCKARVNYTWDFGDGTPLEAGACVSHAYSLPGTYKVTVTWINTCGNELSKTYEVTVEACPCKINVSFRLTTNDLNITVDGSATTSSQPIALYVWDFGDGSVGMGQVANHTYASSGIYTVTLTVYSMGEKGEICDCYDKCSLDAVVRRGIRTYICNPSPTDKNIAKAVSVAVDAVVLKASPNPFSDRVTVSFETGANVKANVNGNYLLEFVNANGVVLQTSKLRSLTNSITFDAKNYSPGFYFVILKNSTGQIQNKKVIKL